MAKTVPTPLSIRLRRLRERAGPALVLLAAAPLTLWMWQRHAGVVAGVGEAVAVRVDIAAPADGMLLAATGVGPEPFDAVLAGQTLLRLDDAPLAAALNTLRATIAVTRAELEAETARWRQDRQNEARSQEIARQRLAIEVQDTRLDLLDRRTAIEFDTIELRRVEQSIAALEQLFDQRVEPEFTLNQERLRRDALAASIESQRAAYDNAQAQHQEAVARLAEVPGAVADDLEALLGPIRAAVLVHEAQIAELEVQARLLRITAPFDGVVTAVHARPGQTTTSGSPLLSLASEHADAIVTYVRERNPADLEVGGLVELRPVRTRGAAVTATIRKVGAQVEPVPEHQRADPTRPEWGLPVLIARPPELDVRPGELVRVRFR